MQIVISVISVDAPQTVPTKNGKSYQFIEVAYKKDGKIEGKKIMSFVNPAVFKAVQNMEVGKDYTITTEKGEANAAGQSFWQWTAVDSGASTGATAPTTAAVSTGTKSVSNYETKEERADRQQLIIRQSSLANAIALLEANGGKKNTVEEAIQVADQFVNYVNNDQDPAAGSRESFDNLLDDIPI